MELKFILILAFLWVSVCCGNDPRLVFHPNGVAVDLPEPQSPTVKKLVTEAAALATKYDEDVKAAKAGTLDYKKVQLRIREDLRKFEARLRNPLNIQFANLKDQTVVEKLKEFINKILDFTESMKCFVTICDPTTAAAATKTTPIP